MDGQSDSRRTKYPYRPGDRVVFRKLKQSLKPGPRARSVSPASKGDTYAYVVDKYWVVESIEDDDTLILRTRTGKNHQVPVDDPNIRQARLWEQLFLAKRFPQLADHSAE